MAERRHTFGQKWGDDPFTGLGYTQTPNALIRYASRLGLKSEECWLIVCILRFKYDQHNPMPSQTTLADLFGQSVDTIQRTVQKIVKKGLLNVERVRSDHGHFTHTVYDFTPLRNALNRCYLSDHPQDTAHAVDPLSATQTTPQKCGLDGAADSRGGRGRRTAVSTRPQGCGVNKNPATDNKQETNSNSKTSLFDETLESAAAELAEVLVLNNVNRADAVRLAREKREECLRQLEYLPHVTEFKSSRGAWLRSAIEGGFAPPKAYLEELRRQTRDERAAERSRTVAKEAADRQSRLAQLRASAERDPARWEAVQAEATARIPDLFRSHPERVVYRKMLNGYIDEVLLELAAEGEDA